MHILRVRLENIDGRSHSQHHIGNDRFKGGLCSENDADPAVLVKKVHCGRRVFLCSPLIGILALDDQLPGGAGLRMREDFLHQPVFHKASLLDDRHIVADLPHDRHLVRDNDDRDPRLGVDTPQKIQNGGCRLRIQRTGGFIAQKDLWIAGQRPGNGDSLSLAAGQLCRIGFFLVLQPDGPEELSGFLCRFLLLHALDLEREADIIQNRFLHQQVEALEDHADAASKRAKLFVREFSQLLSLDDDLSLCGYFKIIQAPDKRALSGSGHTDDPVDIPFFDFKTDIPQGVHPSVLGQERLAQVPDFNNLRH